mgnify:CR=1 FL=1|tara:strand:- start:568 stop:720 length:153 start_codon:yes stop_codon:yes gene_type:complete
MAYVFKELTPDTYEVRDHTIYKDGNGNWVSNPPVEDTRPQKAIINFTKTL